MTRGPGAPAAAPLKVLAVSGDMHASIAQIRLVQPLTAWAQAHGQALRLRSLWQCGRRDLQWADVLLLQRPSGRKQLAWFQRQRARGLPIVLDIDDLLWQPAAHLDEAERLAREATTVMQMLGQATLISTSTARLAQHMAGFGPPVHLVPNHAPALAPGGLPAHHQADHRPTVVVAASDRQQVQALAQALAKLQTEGLDFSVLAIGPVADGLHAGGLRVDRLPLLPHAEFMQTLAHCPSPIGAIAVDGSEFSACKSAVKFFDYASLGLPSVCVARPPYADVVQPGRTGLLCPDQPDAWAQALRSLITDHALRQRLAQAAATQVQQDHGLNHTVAAWQRALSAAAEAAPRSMRADAKGPARWADSLLGMLQAAAMPLRRWNRQRRQRRPGKPGPPKLSTSTQALAQPDNTPPG